MPKGRPFIDSKALIGRPYRAPESEIMIDIQPSSRSLRELAKFDKTSRFIRIEIKDGLRLDVTQILGDRIKIKKRDAIKLANWILGTYKLKDEE